MSPLVIDCSVTMPWCFANETTEYSEAVLDAVVHESAVAPALWALEVANVLATSLRKKALTSAKVGKFRDLLQRLHVRLEVQDQDCVLKAVLDLARKHRLTSYDAAYLEVAARLKLPLASLDKELLAAARADGVDVFAG